MSIGEDIFEQIQDPNEAWGSRRTKNDYARKTADWLKDKGNWETFATLTFRKDVTRECAEKLLKRLIMQLNKEIFGNHYTRTVGHSYFSYMYSAEYQSRGAVHFHVLFDGPVNRDRIKKLWERWAGDADVGPTQNAEGAIIYLSKGGEIAPPFIAKNKHRPIILPAWWN